MRSSPSRPPGDFFALLQETAHPFTQPVDPCLTPHRAMEVHGTTVIALKYRDGVLNLGDRRATAGGAILYDRAEKILALDDYTLIAISGSYARAFSAVQYLRHAFKYYARTQLQEMSLEGKLAEVSRILAGNLASALQGVGAFIPVLSAYDRERKEGRIFFYDALGARFEQAEYGSAGSGSERIRGVFDYIIKTRGPFREMTLETALLQALLLLDIASELDSATGGYTKVLPQGKYIDAEGVRDIPEEYMRTALQKLGDLKNGL
jgi:proteasome beta subunit